MSGVQQGGSYGQGFHKALPPDVGVEQLIHQFVHVFKGTAAFDKLLIVYGRSGDVEVIAPAGVVFGVYPVEGEGDLLATFEKLQVFPGIETVQNVPLVPLPQPANSGDTADPVVVTPQPL